VAGATSYTVYYTVDGTTPSSSNNSDYNTSTTNSITFTPISTAFGLPVTIAVTASNDNGEGSFSAVAAGSTLVPTNVVATALGGGTLKISVAWTAVPGALTYNVYHTFGKSATGTVPTESSPSTSGVTSTSYSWKADSANAGDYYHFAISAVNAVGEGGLSAVVTAQAE
jgi:hypothetical protein